MLRCNAGFPLALGTDLYYVWGKGTFIHLAYSRLAETTGYSMKSGFEQNRARAAMKLVCTGRICTEEIEGDGNTNKARKGKPYRIHKKEITEWDIKMKTAQLLAWVPKVLQSLGDQ